MPDARRLTESYSAFGRLTSVEKKARMRVAELEEMRVEYIGELKVGLRVLEGFDATSQELRVGNVTV